MKLAKTYSLFDPHPHVTNVYHIRDNGLVCHNNTCSFTGGASFDQNGDMLIPSSGEPQSWANEALPQLLNPIPCCFDITVAGVDNHAIEDSWCQQCDIMNGSYKYVYSWYFPTYEDNYIFSLLFCTKDNPINTGYNRIASVLEIGRMDGIEFTNGTYLPEESSDYIYKHENQAAEGREPVYVCAITFLHHFANYTGLGGYLGIPPFTWPSSFLMPETPCLPAIFYKTVIGEYKGDYHFINGKITPILYSGECQDPKPYHGDLDLRSLSFTVTASDAWPYHDDPTGNYTLDELTTARYLCNMDGLSITVAGNNPGTVATDGPVDGYNDISTECGYTSFGSPFLAQEAQLVNSRDLIGAVGSVSGGAGFLDMCEATVTHYGAISDNVQVTIDGVVATTTDFSSVHDCVDAADLNGSYTIGPYTGNPPLWWMTCNYADLTIWDEKAYFSDIDGVCCRCSEVPSGCIQSLSVYLDGKGASRIHEEDAQVATTIQTTIAGNKFEYTFDNWGAPEPIDFNGLSVTLEMTEEGEYGENTYNMDGASVTVRFPEVARIECVSQPEVCSSFNDNLGPEDIIITIPNNWANAPDRWPNSYSRCWADGIWQVDECRRKEIYRCGINPYDSTKICGWQITDEIDCLPPSEIVSYEDCFGGDPPVPLFNLLPSEVCAEDIPIGEYMLTRYSDDDSTYPFWNGCAWFYLEEGGSSEYEICHGLSIHLYIIPSLDGEFTIRVALTSGVGDQSWSTSIQSHPGNQISYTILDGPYEGLNKPMCKYYIDSSQLDGLSLTPDSINEGTPMYWPGGNITLSLG